MMRADPGANGSGAKRGSYELHISSATTFTITALDPKSSGKNVMDCIWDVVKHCLTCPHVHGDRLTLQALLPAHDCASSIFVEGVRD
jgi:hypothetical protein